MADKSNNKTNDGNAMFIPVSNRVTNAYNQVAVNARVNVATPHELIDMLYDGLLTTLAQAKGAMERKEIPEKGKAITKAVRLLEEGLKASLSPMGGELTNRLSALYDYCIVKLTQANVRNDMALLNEVTQLIEPIAQSWKTIGPEVNTH